MRHFKTTSDLVENYNGGTFITIEIEREVKTLKSFDGKITKKSKYKNARLGMAYDNLKQTIELRESGELPKENAGLPWGKWKTFPYVLEHKGKEYLRVYSDFNKIESTYFLNGNEVKKSDILQYLLSSEKSDKKPENPLLTMSIKSENVLNVLEES